MIALSKLSLATLVGAMGTFAAIEALQIPAAFAQAETRLDPNNFEMQPFLEIYLPKPFASDDNRLVLLTNSEGAVQGVGFDGSLGSPKGAENSDLRADLDDIHRGKMLKIGKKHNDFMQISGNYFSSDGGVLTLNTRNRDFNIQLEVYKDHGVWRTREVKWEVNKFVPVKSINALQISTNWKFDYIYETSKSVEAYQRWEELKKRGNYPTYRSQPVDDSSTPKPTTQPTTLPTSNHS